MPSENRIDKEEELMRTLYLCPFRLTISPVSVRRFVFLFEELGGNKMAEPTGRNGVRETVLSILDREPNP